MPNRTLDYQGLILIVIGGLTPKKEEEMLNELNCDNLINFFHLKKLEKLNLHKILFLKKFNFIKTSPLLFTLDIKIV